MPEFVQPQQDPAADQPGLSEEQRKQDCERNAAKRWLPAHSDELRPYRPFPRRRPVLLPVPVPTGPRPPGGLPFRLQAR